MVALLSTLVFLLINVFPIKCADVMGPNGDLDLLKEMFQNYMKEYKKDYIGLPSDDPLVQKRFEAFTNNVNRIAEHNMLYDAGESSFSLGLNHLADLTDAEYKSLLGYRSNQNRKHQALETVDSSNGDDDIPPHWDWRDTEKVTPVKNQGMCGSCWAFSAVAAMESAHAIKTGELLSFSEQELVDCTQGGADTCNHGGEMHDGIMEIVEHHKGMIDLESDYSYTAKSLGVCKADDSKGHGHFTGYGNVTSGDEKALKIASHSKSVISVGIDASSFLFQLYKHGVFSWPLCKNKASDLDHGVAVVGYGTKAGKDFWLVKNSWGPGWGMDGYILMTRNKNNQCGIATDACFPIAA